MESGFRVGKDCFDDSKSLVMISGQGETELRCRNHGGKWQRTSFAEKKKHRNGLHQGWCGIHAQRYLVAQVEISGEWGNLKK